MSIISIIPAPKNIALPEGFFSVGDTTVLQAGHGAEAAAEILAAALNRLLTWQIKVNAAVPDGVFNRISLNIDKGAMPESYRLEILPDRLSLSGDKPGVFYGVQTLLQMIHVDISHIFPRSTYKFRCCRIEDAPRFPWRGFMLDSARYYQSKNTVLRLIEQLALYKINRLHWHLMDNFGWRVMLENYPALTSYDPESWYNAGFYRPEDIREIVDYAAAHFIEVIPEIEMPAHSCGVFRHYPDLACPNEDPYKNNVYEYCLGNPESERFLQNVIREILAIFNKSRFCHLGGDEADTAHWDNCPRCRQARQELNLPDSRALESDFMRRMTEFAVGRGVTPVIWAGESNPAPETILQIWRDDDLTAAASEGHYLINSWNRLVYFDYPADATEDRFEWMPFLPLEEVYEYDPAPPGLPPEVNSRILGGEACLWTEKVPEEKLFDKIFPRLHAFAESVWSPVEKREWKDFKRRSQLHDNSIFMRLKYMLKPMPGNTRLADIARETKVSKTAVSLFINGKVERNKLAMETCARIATAIRSSQYRPSIHARAIQQKKSYLIGAVVPRDLDSRIWRLIQDGMQSVLDREDYRLLSVLCDNDAEAVRKSFASLRTGGVDAFVLFDDRRELPGEITAEEKPVVNLIFSSRLLASVPVELVAAGRKAAEVLAGQPGRNIVLLEPEASRFFAPAISAFAISLRELKAKMIKAKTAGDIPEDCHGVLAISPEALAELRVAMASGRKFETVTFAPPPETVNALFLDLRWFESGRKAAKMILEKI